MKVVLALVVTRHYQFEAFGHTADEARAGLRTAMLAHAKQYGLHDPEGWIEREGEPEVREYELGVGYRDNQRI